MKIGRVYHRRDYREGLEAIVCGFLLGIVGGLFRIDFDSKVPTEMPTDFTTPWGTEDRG